jgi:hypothetical protein
MTKRNLHRKQVEYGGRSMTKTQALISYFSERQELLRYGCALAHCQRDLAEKGVVVRHSQAYRAVAMLRARFGVVAALRAAYPGPFSDDGAVAACPPLREP